jgi:nucleoside-diphosphate-sugar epimerase
MIGDPIFRQDKNGLEPGACVLVTGATGFTGSVLARKLCQNGMKVRAIARASSSIRALDDLDIQWIRGDVFDETIVQEAIRGVEYIFHLAAAFREARYGDDYYHKVHVISTQLLARAALGLPGFKRFIHVSTIGVHGHIDEPPANESYRFAPGDVYQNTKAEAELWVREFADREHLPYTVIRPAGIYGPGDRRLLKLFRMAFWKLFPMLGNSNGLFHLIHVEDLSDAIILSATHSKAQGEVFICGNVEPIRIMEMARTIAHCYGHKLRVIRMPVWPFILAADVTSAVCKPLGIEPPIHRRRVAFYTKDRAFDTRKIRETLGWQPCYSNQAGLEQTARWYAEQGWVRP